MLVAIGSLVESKKDEQKIFREPKNSDHGIHKKHWQVLNSDLEVQKKLVVSVS